MYSKTSLIRPTMGADFKWPIKVGGWFRGLECWNNGMYWAIVWDPNKVVDIGEWSICGGGWLERFYFLYMCVCVCVCVYIYMCV